MRNANWPVTQAKCRESDRVPTDLYSRCLRAISTTIAEGDSQ
jgi:hypothetical protein